MLFLCFTECFVNTDFDIKRVTKYVDLTLDDEEEDDEDGDRQTDRQITNRRNDKTLVLILFCQHMPSCFSPNVNLPIKFQQCSNWYLCSESGVEVDFWNRTKTKSQTFSLKATFA